MKSIVKIGVKLAVAIEVKAKEGSQSLTDFYDERLIGFGVLMGGCVVDERDEPPSF